MKHRYGQGNEGCIFCHILSWRSIPQINLLFTSTKVFSFQKSAKKRKKAQSLLKSLKVLIEIWHYPQCIFLPDL